MSGARVVVLCCGNPSRGDDALGPLVAERVERWIDAQGGAVGVSLVVDFQLQVEHALELEGCEVALFVDASVAGEGAFEATRIEAGEDMSWTSHALTPRALLGVYQTVVGAVAPEAWLLAIRGYGFELGEGLSRGATDNLERAWGWAERWLRERTR